MFLFLRRDTDFAEHRDSELKIDRARQIMCTVRRVGICGGSREERESSERGRRLGSSSSSSSTAASLNANADKSGEFRIGVQMEDALYIL